MLRAEELNGTHVGKRIRWYRGGRERETDPITMITHKKNRCVRVRHGVRGAEPEFKCMDLVEVLTD